MSAVQKLLSRIVRRQPFTTYGVQTKLFRTLSNESNKNILYSPFPDVEIPNISIQEYIFSYLEKYGKFDAMECGLTGRKYTYNDLRTKSRNLSKALRKKLKLEEKDVVAMLLPNVPEIAIVILGTLESRMILTTLNPIYTPEEIARQLIDSSAKAIITLNDLYKVARTSTNLIGKNLPILTIKTEMGQTTPTGAINFNEFTDNSIDIPDIEFSNSNDLAFMPYSSGTTGLPKGVELTHFNIVANISQNCIPPELQIFQSSTENHQDVIPGVLPIFHIYGLTVCQLISLTQGSKIVTLAKFTPENYISVLKNYKCSVLFTVPPLALFISSHPAVKKEYLSTVREIICGAAPLGALDEERLLNKFGHHLLVGQGYGLTETSPTVTISPRNLKVEKKVRGSVGVPLPNTYLKVVDLDDPTCTALGPNKTGELLVKGPQVMKGYHNKPKETNETFADDGWMRTGDMVYYNEDKLLFVTDRLKELIKVKGFQVPPAELEEIIRNFPSVDDAAVIGIPDEQDGEVPRAYVIAKKDQKIDCQELNDFVASKVAPFKQLKGGICVVDSIPKTTSGKILRRQIKINYENEINRK